VSDVTPKQQKTAPRDIFWRDLAVQKASGDGVKKRKINVLETETARGRRQKATSPRAIIVQGG